MKTKNTMKSYNIHNNKTLKNRKMVVKSGKDYIIHFLCMLNTVKLYHWKTHSYPQHKATDELYEKLNEHIDDFIEVYLGKNPRIDLTKTKTIPLKDFNSFTEFKKIIEYYKSFLISLNLGNNDVDLLAIRDEILADLNQFLYLLTFK